MAIEGSCIVRGEKVDYSETRTVDVVTSHSSLGHWKHLDMKDDWNPVQCLKGYSFQLAMFNHF